MEDERGSVTARDLGGRVESSRLEEDLFLQQFSGLFQVFIDPAI